MAKAWIITTDSNISGALALAQADSVTAVVVGDADVAGVTDAVRVPLADGVPAEAAAPAVAAAIAPEGNDLILATNTAAGRVLAGAVAAKLNAPILHGLKAFTGDSATLSRFGGISAETVSVTGPVVAVVDGVGPAEGAAVAATDVAGDTHAATIDVVNQESGDTVNLAAAKRIVAAGRGFGAEEELQLAHDLAEVLGAEVACSRPLAEGNHWMDRESYIGISGQHVAPEIYVAAGISGQIQHTAGMDGSKTVITINNDKQAAMFEQSDYGIVGDLKDVLPALTAALKA